MNAQSNLLDILVKLASFGTSGICIFAIFSIGVLIKKVSKYDTEKHKTLRYYMAVCMILALVSAIPGILKTNSTIKELRIIKGISVSNQLGYNQLLQETIEIQNKLERKISREKEIIELINKNVPEISDKFQKIVDEIPIKRTINYEFYEDMPDVFLEIDEVNIEVKELQNNNLEKNVRVQGIGGIMSFEVYEDKLYRVIAKKDGYLPFLEKKRGSELTAKSIQLIPVNK